MTGATHDKGNILDSVLANKDDIVTRLRIHDAFELPVDTNHHMIFIELSLCQTKSPSRKPVIVFDYKKADWAGLCADFVDVEFIWASIKLIALEAMDRFIPKVRLWSHQLPVKFTLELNTT